MSFVGALGGVTPVVSRALKMEGPAGADFPETTTSVKALPELSELQEEVEEVVCECLITAVALLEVADGKEKDRREIKIASGVQNFVEVEIVASVRSVCSWRPLRKVTAVTVCGCKILSWMRRLRWLLQATAMTEQCMIGFVDRHATAELSSRGKILLHPKYGLHGIFMIFYAQSFDSTPKKGK